MVGQISEHFQHRQQPIETLKKNLPLQLESLHTSQARSSSWYHQWLKLDGRNVHGVAGLKEGAPLSVWDQARVESCLSAQAQKLDCPLYIEQWEASSEAFVPKAVVNDPKAASSAVAAEDDGSPFLQEEM